MKGAQVYAQTQKAGLTPREAEATALRRSAFLINKSVERPEDGALFSQAWELTNDLWSIIRREALNSQNPLPVELRANIVSLAIFVDKRLIKAALSEDASDLAAIANINHQLAEGLSGRATDGEPESSEAEPAALP